MSKTTSRVFACWRALHADLQAAMWPRAGDYPVGVLVDFGLPVEFAGEAVTVPGRVPREQMAQWRTWGQPGQDETFRLLVGVTTRAPGRTSLEALDRLEELCDVVQSTVRNQTTGQPAGSNLAALAIPTMRWHVASVQPGVYPWADGGFAADCAIEIEFTARI